MEKSTYRIAHLCDLHIDDRSEVLAACSKALGQVMDLKPNHIITGGDAIRDGLKDEASVVEAHWNSFDQFNIQLAATGLPVNHVLGNHDIDGGLPPEVAKNQAYNRYKLQNRYYTVHTEFWLIIILDSSYVINSAHGYEARLDDKQFSWLEETLVHNTKPVCIISHIPILSGAVFLDGDLVKNDNWVVPGAWMHLDSVALNQLFTNHPEVKLCLSGHLHLHEELRYNNVSYVCNGAVSGNWWQGKYNETEPGFGIIDLHSDGTFKTEYHVLLGI